mgnify:CR=1 FL=1|tara:strand:- start:6229 stop:7266 length:1038 start_codon:yes stop_codon:yes gene_type:complete
MDVNSFDYNLPKALIADRPVIPRDSSRLLVVDNKFRNKRILDLPNILQSGDTIIFNNTQVIPALLHGRQKNKSIQITLIRNISGLIWIALAKPAKKILVGEIINFGQNFSALITKKIDGQLELKFNCREKDFPVYLQKYGELPLPPYIKRDSSQNNKVEINYQTIFAEEPGAVAAPTAGLHFTYNLFKQLKEKNIKTLFLTLHVGPGTFLPVRAKNTDQHKMHSEWFKISSDVSDIINYNRKNGGRIIAVGTTSLRALETASNNQGIIKPMTGYTDLFIVPGYNFKVVDVLLTNFHLPRSTLLMLVSAFSGLEKILDAYNYAIDKNYRFFSYGDACLLYRQDLQK